MNKIRSILFVAWLYLALGYVGLAYWIPSLLNPRGVVAALRAWAKAALFGLRWIMSARLEFEGLEHAPKGPALIAAKHQSMLDTLVPALVLDWPAFVYKEELKSSPVVGWYLQRGKMIPVARDQGATALKSLLRHAKQAIADGRQIIIFPEGTRQPIGAAPDYKPGVAALYMSLKIPCTPVALNTGTIWPSRGLWRKPGVAKLRFLPPIPAGLSRDDFMRELEARIEGESEAMLPDALRRAS
jgi:1-acyl-sn-glycerol-3-phosphate acyltransferase